MKKIEKNYKNKITHILLSRPKHKSRWSRKQEMKKMENQKKYYDYMAGKDDSLIEYEVEIPGENKW